MSHDTLSSKILQHPQISYEFYCVCPTARCLANPYSTLQKFYQVVTTSKFLVITWAIRKVLLFLQVGTVYYYEIHSKTKSRSSCIPMTQTGIPGFVVKAQRKIWYRFSITVKAAAILCRCVTWPGISVSFDSRLLSIYLLILVSLVLIIVWGLEPSTQSAYPVISSSSLLSRAICERSAKSCIQNVSVLFLRIEI